MAITSGAGAYAATQRLLSAGGQGGGLSPGLSAAAGGGSFTALLEQAVGGVAEAGRKAEAQAVAAAGGKADLVDVVTAVAESETALQTLVAVRDKVIAAYEEILRMPI
ncbi:flagellar hook-basal body complex protein FliE [Enterovirga aerilata]|uniref:Flagellar hook-basal body complex protein FliE n=1 Tax=Enterovirga aerilata TaxID=2730920 RepID=A0A849ICI9_9HYPH|nr:flagellar hook-basal body complex protein FliE [Enterovirga sp. DB1703]NNM71643.1 flagellar hook-basal body complex protein FliE [Enterovirga sp. DB1703]